MASLEKILLNAVNFNDATKLSMESLTFTPAQAKAKFAENPNSDGVVLVEEPQYTPAYFDMMVRVVSAKKTDEALVVIGEVMDALTACARTEEGSEVEWTPNEGSITYAAYALLGELLEMPITVTGELAGWFIRFPVLKIKLTCRPFLFTDERLVLASTTSETQFQVAYVKGIEGDVPAEGRMVITDKATKKRRFVEWGQDLVESEVGNPSIQLKGETMVTAGFGGTSTIKAGSVSTNVITAKVIPIPVTVCSTGPISNLGSYRIKERLWSTGGVQLRASYRIGDGPLTSRGWVEIPQTEQWVEIDLYEALLEEPERGDQVSQINIEAKSANGATIYLDTMGLMPTKRFAVARGLADFSTPSVLSIYEPFSAPEGALTGKVAEIGGTWEGAGDAVDFTKTGGSAYRTEKSDAVNLGRYNVLPTKYTNIFASLDVGNTNPRNEYGSCGSMALIVRYKDTNNWLRYQLSRSASGIGGNHWYGYLSKRVGGVVTYSFGPPIGPNNNYSPIVMLPYFTPFYDCTLELLVLEDGTFRLGANGEVLLTGQDADLATGGALAEGKVGINDEMTTADSSIRYFDNLTAFQPTIGIVCNSGKSVEIRPNDAQIESTTGKYWNPVSPYRGSDFYLDPSGPDALVNRLAVKVRRADTKVEPDTVVNDKHALEVFARERFLVPR